MWDSILFFVLGAEGVEERKKEGRGGTKERLRFS